MRGHLVSVDIGGSKIAVMAHELGTGNPLYADKLKTPADDGIEAILELLDEQIASVPGGRRAMRALGVAVPGHVDPHGHVLDAGNLRGWTDVPLRELLEKRYGTPVFVERDANCGALGEKWLGAARKMNDFVFLALGTGVGAGIFLGGRLHRGAHFAAGEAGDMIFPSGDSLGEVVGKRAIKRKVKRATGKKMSAADALAQARYKPQLERATKEPVDHLSHAVVAICALLDPEAILFGGGTSSAGEPLLERVREQALGHVARPPRLMVARLGNESQLYGALWGAANLVRSADIALEAH